MLNIYRTNREFSARCSDSKYKSFDIRGQFSFKELIYQVTSAFSSLLLKFINSFKNYFKNFLKNIFHENLSPVDNPSCKKVKNK